MTGGPRAPKATSKTHAINVTPSVQKAIVFKTPKPKGVHARPERYKEFMRSVRRRNKKQMKQKEKKDRQRLENQLLQQALVVKKVDSI